LLGPSLGRRKNGGERTNNRSDDGDKRFHDFRDKITDPELFNAD